MKWLNALLQILQRSLQILNFKIVCILSCGVFSRIQLPIDVVLEFIVAAKHDDSSKGHTEREKHLTSGRYPHLRRNTHLINTLQWFFKN